MSKTYAIEKYSEAAFAVFGDTEPIRHILEALNGKENPNLKNRDNPSLRRHGWIFPNGMMQTVSEACATGIIPPKYTSANKGKTVKTASSSSTLKSIVEKPPVIDPSPPTATALHTSTSQCDVSSSNEELRVQVSDLKKQVNQLLKQMDALQCDVASLAKLVTGKPTIASSSITAAKCIPVQPEEDEEDDCAADEVDYGDCDAEDIAFFEQKQAAKKATVKAPIISKTTAVASKTSTASVTSTKARPSTAPGGSLLKRQPKVVQ